MIINMLKVKDKEKKIKSNKKKMITYKQGNLN